MLLGRDHRVALLDQRLRAVDRATFGVGLEIGGSIERQARWMDHIKSDSFPSGRALPERASCLSHDIEFLALARPDRSVGDPVAGRPARGLRHAEQGRDLALDTRAISTPRPRRRRRRATTRRRSSSSSASRDAPPASLLAQQAQIERAYYLWKSGEKAQALSTLERFIKLHPTSRRARLRALPAGPDQLQRQPRLPRQPRRSGPLASATSRPRATPTSRSRQLVDQFPQSTYAEDARAAHELHRQLARGLRGPRGALLPAPRRLRRRCQPGAAGGAGVPAVAVDRGSAGASWPRATTSSGSPSLRDDTERVLKTNFPNATINVDVFGKQATPWWKLW